MKIFTLIFVFLAEAALFGQFGRPVAADALVFELDFDRESVVAGLAEGEHKPIMQFGKVSFQPGIRGMALYCGDGGAKVRFKTAGNLDFDRPGSITFWFKAVNWDDDKLRRTMFFGTEASDGYFGVQVANDPKTRKPYDRDIQAMILYSKRIQNKTMMIPPITAAGVKDWHLISLAWSGNRIFLSRDGEPYAAQQLSGPVSKEALPTTHFSVGADSEWNYLLDEFRIYSRKLTDEELKQLWEQDKK